MLRIIGALLCIFILSVGGALAESAGNIVYSLDGQSYAGYYLEGDADLALVLLIHDWDGLGDYEIRRAQMLNDLGYSVLAADLFGAGIRPAAIADRQKLTGELYKDRERMRKLIYAALSEAEKRGAKTKDVVAIGYCFGATAVLELARSGADLKGFVSFHGGLATPKGQDYAKTKGQMLILHGTADSAISMDEFATLAKELESAGIDHEMITYGGAEHAFSVFDTPRYHKNADRKSWQRFVEFLGSEHF